MDVNDAIRALRSHGKSVRVRDARHLDIDDRSYRHAATRSTPTRADATRALEAGDAVVFTPDTLTPSLRAFALKEPRAAVVTEEEIILDGRAITLREDKVHTVSKRGPKPYGRYALARALLATRGSFTQLELAERVRITQGAVAKALQHDLFADAIVQTRAGGVHVTDRGELFDRILDSYPGPGGITTYWWKDTAPSLQANDIIDADPAALRSGDVAADLTRAWRRPEHAVVYAQRSVDPRDLGFATADGSDYTLMIIHAADPTIPATAKTWMAPERVDPIIAAYDVRRTGTTGDQEEAVARLREYTVSGMGG